LCLVFASCSVGVCDGVHTLDPGFPRQALTTAELSTLMDVNGGYVVWVRRGMGNFWGWVSAYNKLASNVLDLPVYAALFGDYMVAFAGRYGVSVSPVEAWCVRLAALVFVTGVNLRPMHVVSMVSTIATVFVIAPFLVQPFFALTQLESCGSDLLQTAPDVDWSLFISTLLWNYQGWDGLGTIAGEVADGGRTYPLGVVAALVLMSVTYALPVVVGIAVVPNYADWTDGYLAVIGEKIGGYMGVWVLLGAAVSQVGALASPPHAVGAPPPLLPHTQAHTRTNTLQSQRSRAHPPVTLARGARGAGGARARRSWVNSTA
jgi:amino acid transporter